MFCIKGTIPERVDGAGSKTNRRGRRGSIDRSAKGSSPQRATLVPSTGKIPDRHLNYRSSSRAPSSLGLVRKRGGGTLFSKRSSFLDMVAGWSRHEGFVDRRS